MRTTSRGKIGEVIRRCDGAAGPGAVVLARREPRRHPRSRAPRASNAASGGLDLRQPIAQLEADRLKEAHKKLVTWLAITGRREPIPDEIVSRSSWCAGRSRFYRNRPRRCRAEAWTTGGHRHPRPVAHCSLQRHGPWTRPAEASARSVRRCRQRSSERWLKLCVTRASAECRHDESS
jgi:hypothetical protein